MGIFIVVLITAIYWAYSFWNQKYANQSLTLYGNVDIRQVDLGFRVSGKLEKMLYEEGDVVNAGELLAVLDKAPYEAAFSTAQAQLREAEANYEKLLRGSRPQEIEEARAAVQEAEANLKNANLLYKRQSQEITLGATSQQTRDDALKLKTQAQASLKSAKEALSLAIEGFREEDIAAGKAALESAKAQLEAAKINLEDTEVKAPSSGTIFTRVLEPGAIVSPQSIVYSLSLHKPIWVRAYISEPKLGLIKPGTKALVYTDTFPDQPYEGQIGFISPQAEFTPKTVETPELRTDLVFRLRIWVNDPKGQLRQGMPVTVKIKLSE